MSPSKREVEVRRIRSADARAYRAILVEALIVHPDCFSSDYNEELSRPLQEIETTMECSGTFGAWSGSTLIGIASGIPCSELKRRHCGRIRNLYVREDFRGRGIGGMLLQEVVRHAACSVERLEVEIPFPRENVVRLFERQGFRMCGLIPNCLRVGHEELDVWTMNRALR